MSYHNIPSSAKQSTTNDQGQTAPAGYHYMPDGTLMSDVEHAKLYGETAQSQTVKSTQHASKYYNPYQRDPVNINSQTGSIDKVIKNFNLDLSDLSALTKSRKFIIQGDKSAEFILEIKNEDNYYYNFTTNLFQAAQSRLEKVILNDSYKGSITFPTVTDNDQYDIFLYAKPGTKHSEYIEKRFGDGSLDINKSKGSNSLMMQKVIYQYVDLTLTIGKASPNSTIEMTGTGHTTDSLTISRGKNAGKVPFSLISVVSTATKAYQIIKQPTLGDIFAQASLTVGSAPELLPGENEYPTARAAFTGDDVNGAITSGAVVRMDNTDLSAVIAVGDKITAATIAGTVNGAVADGDTFNLDETAANVAAVGDSISGPGCPFCDANPSDTACIVTNVGSGGTANRITIDSSGTEFVDGGRITFSSKVNRSLTTVTVVETSGTATDFTMSQAIQFRDNQELTFTPQKNFQWPLDDVNRITKGMIVFPGTNVTASTSVDDYKDTITIFPGTEKEEIIVKNEAPFKDTKNATPTLTNGVVTTQPGNIVFDKQQVLLLVGDTITIGGYGQSNIFSISGYDLRVTDLAISLEPIQTTTTAAVSASATIPVTSVNGILPNISAINGIGISANTADPLITARSATSGGGNLTASTAQTLESGITFTFPNAGQKATITGNIEVLKAGTASASILFDVEKLLSIT